uniref:large ribosomal subunit protein uL23m-like isoform X1 n=1 Tax=Doryrhamphus excisus TaxID=161450 RepID=UPI0025AEA3C3|nr:large ribosomal subunit protein uL23m-like isoform X1 [Doryrhamphus excisus]
MPVTRLLYPLYQLGNPQLRIFRPNWFLTLVRPGKEQPPDTVQFRIPMEMTKNDVKNYLEKIYNVPVGAVRTRIQFGSNKKRNHLNQRVKQPDYKVAYVQLEVVWNSLQSVRCSLCLTMPPPIRCVLFTQYRDTEDPSALTLCVRNCQLPTLSTEVNVLMFLCGYKIHQKPRF